VSFSLMVPELGAGLRYWRRNFHAGGLDLRRRRSTRGPACARAERGSVQGVGCRAGAD